MPYFACFRYHESHQFRLDTRIYLQDEEPGADDACVAAIIGKNPGSANPTSLDNLARISLDGDKLLPYVRNRFRGAYRRAGVVVPAGAFVRVWNLVYLCNKDLAAAVRSYQQVRAPLTCDSESALPPIVWFAWGPPSPRFLCVKDRFMQALIEHPFYYDMESRSVVGAVPDHSSRVKHTQGLPAEPVEEHLAAILRG